MSKFNAGAVRPATTSFITSEATPSGRTHQGGAGYARNVKSELFLLAITNMVSEKAFYEPGKQRDERYAQLIHQATVEDANWTARFLTWLRAEANMRTASIVGAAEFVKVRLGNDVSAAPAVGAFTRKPGDVVETEPVGLSRKVINSVLLRADEPGEFLAYWLAVHGRPIPKPVKRGVADAATRVFTEFNFLKWDSAARGVRMADVVSLTRAEPVAAWQSDLFDYMRHERWGRPIDLPASLRMLQQRAVLMGLPVTERRGFLDSMGFAALSEAGMTWESLAGWLQGPMDKAAWEAIIPSMGYMALLRNLRNFDEAKVSDEVAETVAAKLADPEQVAKSRQFPMRFLSAHRAVPSARWAWPLEKAIDHSLVNVPELKGNTLILVDTSGSMRDTFSKDGTLKRWDAAVIFGLALARRCEKATVVSFSDNWYGIDKATKRFPLRAGESLLKSIDRWDNGGFFLNGGTDTEAAVRAHLSRQHDRLVILTDEQAGRGDLNDVVPADVPMYTWNLAGYDRGHAPSGSHNRHAFGGLTDQSFRMIPLLEAGQNQNWPF